jgi:hypothetical protein
MGVIPYTRPPCGTCWSSSSSSPSLQRASLQRWAHAEVVLFGIACCWHGPLLLQQRRSHGMPLTAARHALVSFPHLPPQLFAQWLRAHGALLTGAGAPSLAERLEALRGVSRCGVAGSVAGKAEAARQQRRPRPRVQVRRPSAALCDLPLSWPTPVARLWLPLFNRIEADPQYWPVLRRLLAVGQLEAAGELLLEHPAYAAEAGGGLQVRGGARAQAGACDPGEGSSPSDAV